MPALPSIAVSEWGLAPVHRQRATLEIRHRGTSCGDCGSRLHIRRRRIANDCAGGDRVVSLIFATPLFACLAKLPDSLFGRIKQLLGLGCQRETLLIGRDRIVHR